MSDNTELPSGSGGDVLRTEHRAGETYKTPVSIIDVGGSTATEKLIGDADISLPVSGIDAENGAVKGNPVLIGGRYDSTPRTLGNEDVGGIAVDASGQVLVSFALGATAAHQVTQNTALSAIQTATELIDNAVSGAGFNITQFAGAAVPIGAGVEATAVRVTVATDSTGVLSVDDGGGTLTVDGTVTADLSATDNAVLDQIEVNTSYGDQTGGGVEASALRVTIASDSTGVLSVDDGGGALTVDGTVTANLSATDNAVLDQLEVNTSYGDQTGGGVEASALRVTVASDSTGVLSVDDNGSSLTVDTTGTSGLEVVQTVAGDLNCTEASASAIKDAVEIMDDWDDSNDNCKSIPQGRYMMYGTERVEIKNSSGIAATGTVPMVSAPGAGKKIQVLALALVATSATANTVYIGNPTNNDLLGDASNPIPLAIDADGDNIPGLSLAYNPGGWFQTGTANEALNLTLTAAYDIIYALTYIEYTA